MRFAGLTFANDVAWWEHRPIAQPKQEMKPMGKRLRNLRAPVCDDVAATPHLNYLLPDPHETTAQDLDYFVWLIRGHGRYPGRYRFQRRGSRACEAAS